MLEDFEVKLCYVKAEFRSGVFYCLIMKKSSI